MIIWLLIFRSTPLLSNVKQEPIPMRHSALLLEEIKTGVSLKKVDTVHHQAKREVFLQSPREQTLNEIRTGIALKPVHLLTSKTPPPTASSPHSKRNSAEVIANLLSNLPQRSPPVPKRNSGSQQQDALVLDSSNQALVQAAEMDSLIAQTKSSIMLEASFKGVTDYTNASTMQDSLYDTRQLVLAKLQSALHVANLCQSKTYAANIEHALQNDTEYQEEELQELIRLMPFYTSYSLPNICQVNSITRIKEDLCQYLVILQDFVQNETNIDIPVSNVQHMLLLLASFLNQQLACAHNSETNIYLDVQILEQVVCICNVIFAPCFQACAAF